MIKKRILIVDDDTDILNMLSEALTMAGYLVYCAKDATEGMRLLDESIDLLILDVMMPGLDGFEFCKKIRSKVQCPIIFLTAKVLEADLIHGLAIGGDDYLTKPFSIGELKARILANLRQSERHQSPKRTCLFLNGVEIDLKTREIWYENKRVLLTKREYEIVELLVLNTNQVFSKEQIYEKIWGLDAVGDASTVAEHVKKIRAKFQNINSSFNHIKTVWGIGYRWTGDKDRSSC